MNFSTQASHLTLLSNPLTPRFHSPLSPHCSRRPPITVPLPTPSSHPSHSLSPSQHPSHHPLTTHPLIPLSQATPHHRPSSHPTLSPPLTPPPLTPLIPPCYPSFPGDPPSPSLFPSHSLTPSHSTPSHPSHTTRVPGSCPPIHHHQHPPFPPPPPLSVAYGKISRLLCHGVKSDVG